MEALLLLCVSLSQDAHLLLDRLMWPVWQSDFCGIYVAYKTNSKQPSSGSGDNTSTDLDRIFRGCHQVVYHSLSKCFLAALSNTYGSSSGLKILGNKYFLCFVSICVLFTIGSKQCPSFSCEVIQFWCHVFQRDSFMVWGFFHFKLAGCDCTNTWVGRRS